MVRRHVIGLVALATGLLILIAARTDIHAVPQDSPNGRSRWRFGALSEASADVSPGRARAFLAREGTLVAGGDAESLVLVRSVDSPIGRHLVFAQQIGGVPVHGAEVRVHFDRAGRIIGANSSHVADLAPASTTPSVPLAVALNAAARVGGDRAAARGALVFLVVDGAPRLAWRIVAPAAVETWEIFVDARSGGTLAPPRDLNRYATGSGRVFLVNAVVATRDNTLQDQNDAASAVPASAYTIVALPGLDGTGLLDGQFASSARTKKRAFRADNAFLFDRSEDGFGETMGYFAFDYAQRYIQWLGFLDVNNRRQVFSVNRFKGDNSFYAPNTQEITLGLGGVDDSEDNDVIWHEYGHSIQDNQVPGFGSTLEAGSMGEGFGDYWAGTIGAQLSGGFQDTCLAEWDAVSYSSTVPPCLRRLDGTKHYPESVVGEVHADGEIWSAALWQIRGAIGATKADAVVLEHHFLLSPGASFNEAADALVTAAIALGYRTHEVNAIRAILRARGFTLTV